MDPYEQFEVSLATSQKGYFAVQQRVYWNTTGVPNPIAYIYEKQSFITLWHNHWAVGSHKWDAPVTWEVIIRIMEAVDTPFGVFHFLLMSMEAALQVQ